VTQTALRRRPQRLRFIDRQAVHQRKTSTTRESPRSTGVAVKEKLDGAFYDAGNVLFGDGVAEQSVFTDLTVYKHAELV
jgi:hypothetical protein